VHAQYELTLPMRNLTEMFYARDKCSRFHTAWALSVDFGMSAFAPPMGAKRRCPSQLQTALLPHHWTPSHQDMKLSTAHDFD